MCHSNSHESQDDDSMPMSRSNSQDDSMPNYMLPPSWAPTKILTGRTSVSECVFEELFKFMIPKQRFWKAEQTFQNALSSDATQAACALPPGSAIASVRFLPPSPRTDLAAALWHEPASPTTAHEAVGGSSARPKALFVFLLCERE